MPITSDATAVAVESKSNSSSDAQWQRIAQDSQQEMQQTFSASSDARTGLAERGTLDVPSVDGTSTSLAPDSRIFDPRKSVDEIVETGGIVDQTSADANESRTRSATKISIAAFDSSEPQTPEPDFIVEPDGQIVMLRNPETSNSGSIRIAVRKTGAQLTEAQQKSVEGTVTYLCERYFKTTKDGEHAGVIEDDEQLLSEDVAEDLDIVSYIPNTENFEPELEGSTSAVNNGGASKDIGGTGSNGYSTGGGNSTEPRSNDNSSGGSNRGSASDYSGYTATAFNADNAQSNFASEKEPTQLTDEAFNQSVKDVLAFMNDATGPRRYELVSQTRGNEYTVGPYAIGYDQIVGWLQGILGDPIDLTKLDELIKKGLLSKEMVEKIKTEGFQEFVQGLKDGISPSSDQVKNFLPKEVQEQIADVMIENLSAALPNHDAGGVANAALSIMLGHPASVDELSAHKDFVKAGEQRASIQTNDAGNATENGVVDATSTESLKPLFFTQFSHPIWNNYSDAPDFSSNCGPASLSMVLRVLGVGPSGVDLYGDPNELTNAVKIMMTGDDDPSETTNTGQVTSAAQQMNLTTETVGSLDGINRALENGQKIVLAGDPVAFNQNLSIDEYASMKRGNERVVYTGGHFVAVVGRQSDGSYIVMDPAYKLGILTLEPKELEAYMASEGSGAGVAIGI